MTLAKYLPLRTFLWLISSSGKHFLKIQIEPHQHFKISTKKNIVSFWKTHGNTVSILWCQGNSKKKILTYEMQMACSLMLTKEHILTCT